MAAASILSANPSMIAPRSNIDDIPLHPLAGRIEKIPPSSSGTLKASLQRRGIRGFFRQGGSFHRHDPTGDQARPPASRRRPPGSFFKTVISGMIVHPRVTVFIQLPGRIRKGARSGLRSFFHPVLPEIYPRCRFRHVPPPQRSCL